MAPDGMGGAGQTEVMLLGTYHMANPGKDLINVDSDSPLDPERQDELEVVVDRLSRWQPDIVAVEYPHAAQSALDELFQSFADGDINFDSQGSLPESFDPGFIENEVAQLGVRLALVRGHDGILAIDHEGNVPGWTTKEAMAEVINSMPAHTQVSYPMPDPTDIAKQQQARLETSSIGEYLAWLNTPEQLRVNHQLMFGACIEHDNQDPAVGVLTSWYERNIRMVHTLLSTTEARRILAIVGSGHVRVMEHLIEEAPQVRPVSASAYLPEVDRPDDDVT